MIVYAFACMFLFQQVPSTEETILVDGRLDEPIWATAKQISVTHEWFPGDNLPAPVETICLITYNERFLYVAFRAFDPNPAQIRAHLADRDVPISDDNVGIQIDTFNDRRRAYQFRVNALGVQMDAFNDDITGSEDWSWDAIWDAAGAIWDWGYSVEMAIPFKQLRFPRGESELTWGVMAIRDYPRNVEHRLRSFANDRDRECVVCQFPEVGGFHNIKPGRNLEITPTATTGRTEIRNELPDGGFQTGDEETEFGLSARWGISPNTSMQGTLNPDFAQVEADAAQLNVNERFALYFPEKRPFFQEGSEFFDTPVPAVFTRSIIQPRYGLKFTGKEGKQAYGVLFAEDRFNQIIRPGYESSSTHFSEEKATTGVVRWRTDLGEQSSLGLLATYRDADDYHNMTYGVDGSWQVSEADTIRYQLIASSTDDGLGIDTQSGSASDVSYRHRSRNWVWSASTEHRDRGFRADAGFISQVDYRFARAGISRVLWGGSQTWFRKLWFNFGADYTQNTDGSIQENGQDIGLEYEGPMQSYVSVNLAPNREHYEGVDYKHFRQSLYVSMRPSGALSWGMSMNRGETIDVVNAQSADFLTLNPSLQWSIGRHVRWDLEYVRQKFEVDAGRLFRVQLVESHFLVHLNLRTLVRAIVQYREVNRDQDLYTGDVNANSQDLFTQLLFSYKINAQTLLLAGYSDNYEGNDRYDLTQAQRSYYLKIGYAWIP